MVLGDHGNVCPRCRISNRSSKPPRSELQMPSIGTRMRNVDLRSDICLPSPKHELEPHSRICRNILTMIILLQLALGSFIWFESRSLRQLDSQLLDRHAALVSLHERLNQLQNEVRSA